MRCHTITWRLLAHFASHNTQHRTRHKKKLDLSSKNYLPRCFNHHRHHHHFNTTLHLLLILIVHCLVSDIWHVSHSIVSYLCSVDNRVESANFTTQISSSRCSSFHSSSLSIVSIPSALAASSSMSESSPSVNCPVVCSCIWKSGKQTATCDKRNLISVPVGLAATTQVIDLSGNSLNVLPPNVFLDRGIINLQRISLVDCNLGR